MVRIAIVGAGAIGATVAAWLAADPRRDVTLCVRTPFDRLRVDTPGGMLEMQPRLMTVPGAIPDLDWIIVATKTYDMPGVADWLRVLAGDGTRIAILQNGVEHLARFPDIAPDRLVPAVVDIPAERTAPGVVRQRRDGSMVVPAGDGGAAFVDLFGHTPIDVRTSDDWSTVAWRKLAVNCAGAVSALTLRPAGIAHDAEAAGIMRALVRECIAVGRAEGADLPDSLADQVIAGYRQGPADGINSIHADRLAGRPTEADARNGVIVRLGRRHGIATPYNHMADVILRAS